MKRRRQHKPSQIERFLRDRTRIDRSVHRWPQNGWGGGRDRTKPHKIGWHYQVRGVWIGGLVQYAPGSRWFAYDARTNEDKAFWHRRDAKRWVESLPLVRA